jgi:hypothetical protein
LEIPVRTVATEIEHSAPAAPQDFPTLAANILREPAASARTDVMEDGVIVQETFDDYGATRDPNHGLEVGSHVTTRYSIHPDDPTTAQFNSLWTFTFQRDDWRVEIKTENSMTCDAEKFYLHRNLRAVEGIAETEVMTKEWSQTIPRGLL